MSATIDPADILALLEERPYLEAELLELLGVPAQVGKFVLKQMNRAGQIKRVSNGREWALMTYTPPAAPPVDEELEALADIDEDADGDVLDAIADLPRPTARQKNGTRQPHERPPSAAVKKDTPPSWWVGAPRDGFTAAGASHVERMKTSKKYHALTPRLLQ